MEYAEATPHFGGVTQPRWRGAGLVRRLFGLLCSAAIVALSLSAAAQPAAAAARVAAPGVKAQPAIEPPPPPPPTGLPPRTGLPISYHRPPQPALHRPPTTQPVVRAPLSPLAGIGGTWVDMGPKPILSPWWGPTSGVVSALAVDPTAPSTVYAGSVGGGVWKSTDGGANWSPTSDGQPSLAIGSIAIDPSNHTVIYAGTGAVFDGGSQSGAGILKSTNGGGTWTVVGNASGTFNSVSIHQLVIDPGSTSTLYASTNAGIFKSIDSGANWTSIMAFGFSGIADMAIDPTTPSTIYVAAAQGGTSGIFKSTNGGTTFLALTSGLPAAGSAARISLAISHSNPNRLYATMARASNNCSLGVWRSDDGGASWTQLSAPELFAPGAGFPCQGWYDNYTAVDPTNPDVAYVGGIDLWKITGAGTAFTILTPPNHVHPDQHSLAFVSNSSGAAFYIGNDGGAWSTGNSGALFTNLNSTLETALMYSGVAVGGIALGGLQDNGIVKYVGAPGWYELMTGDGSAVNIDPSNPSILYASDYGPLVMYKSTDGGSHFSLVDSGINPADQCFCPAEPAIMDPSHSTTLVAGTFYANVYRTVDGAGSWGLITPGSLVNDYGETHGLAVAPTDTGEIWGAFGWHVFLHTSTGWVERTPGAPFGALYRGLAVDQTNGQHVFVSQGGTSLVGATVFGAVFETTDLGAHWQDITGALPNIPVNALVIDAYGRLLAGTDRGVYAFTCGAWGAAGAGLPNAKVTDLRTSTDGTTVYASTYGRGMWSLGLPATPPCTPPTAVLAQAGNGSATLTWQAPSRSITGYTVTPYASGVAGTPVMFSSPATIEVLGGLTNGTPYTFTVAAVNAAGPGPPSPQTNSVIPSANYPWSVVSSRQYSFAGSDGVTWTDVDVTNLELKITPSADSVAIASANADLWTSVAGFNQDVGISVSGGAYPSVAGQPEAWKESGGFAGTFSPNAAYVQAVLHLKSGVTYTVKLQWKANQPAAGGTIFAGAGPLGPNFSLTRLTAVLMPETPQTVFDAKSTLQYTQAGRDGVTWHAIDSGGLAVSFTPTVASHAIVTANADLWTSVAGFNQDIGVAVSGGAYPSAAGQPEAWKESGGFAGTFSPNAAFVQAVIPLAASTPYIATLARLT